MQYLVANTRSNTRLFNCKGCWQDFSKLKAINTGELEKQIVEPENNYRLKPLLKNQLRKHQLVKEVLEDSKELIA